MFVSRHPHRLFRTLVLNRWLEHHALVELSPHLALDLLPWCLAFGMGEAAVLGQRGAALVQLLVRDQNVGGALLEINAHPVAGLDQRQSPARSRFRGSVENRRRAGGARLAAV